MAIYGESKLIPVAFSKQFYPGTFETTLSYLVDMIVFEERIHNDEAGAPAYEPAKKINIAKIYAGEWLNWISG